MLVLYNGVGMANWFFFGVRTGQANRTVYQCMNGNGFRLGYLKRAAISRVTRLVQIVCWCVVGNQGDCPWIISRRCWMMRHLLNMSHRIC